MNPNNRPLITRLRSAPAWRADHRSRNRRSRAAFTLAKQRERVSAFTLVELLIATGITVAMVLMLGLMLGSLMSSASHATERVDAFRDARAALQMIERDLRNLVRTQWNPDPFTNPTPAPCVPSGVATTGVTVPASYFALKDIYGDPPTASNRNQQLYALVAAKTTASSGDVCAVGYYCRWDDQLHAYSLHRFFRSFSLADMQGWGSYAADTALYDLNAPNATNDVLAAYVWDLQISLYDAAGNRYTTYPCVCDQSASAARLLPAALEISFNAMSPQAARTVMSVSSSPNDWMDTTTQNYQRLIAPHAYQFRSRINLP